LKYANGTWYKRFAGFTLWNTVDCVSTFCMYLYLFIENYNEWTYWIPRRDFQKEFVNESHAHYRACLLSHGASRERISIQTPHHPSTPSVENEFSTCRGANITRSLRWKFIRRRTIIESDDDAARQSSWQRLGRRWKEAERWLLSVWEGSIARTRVELSETKASSAARPWCIFHGIDLIESPRQRWLATRWCLLVVVNLAEREYWPTDRGSQAWEPKLDHEGRDAKIMKPRIEIVAMAGKRARVFSPRDSLRKVFSSPLINGLVSKYRARHDPKMIMRMNKNTKTILKYNFTRR